jgi:hypothetical protein
MSEHRVNVQWTRNGNDFNHETYNRDHTWTFECGTEIKASSAPGFQGNPPRWLGEGIKLPHRKGLKKCMTALTRLVLSQIPC